MKRKKLKFNIIDFFICVVILFVVVFYSFYLNNISKDGSVTDHISAEIVLEAENIKDVYLQSVNVGDTVILAEDGSVFGEIKYIDISDVLPENGENSDNIIIDAESKKVKLTINCDLRGSGDYLFSGDRKIVIGETYNLIVPDAYILAECVSVNIEN